MKKVRTNFEEAVFAFANHYALNSSFLSQTRNITRIFSNCSSNFIFEIELDLPETKPDISICILRKEVTNLLRHWKDENILNSIQQDKYWKRLSRFCIEWKMHGSILNNFVSDIWFEFDSDQIEKYLPGPCFFFSPRNLHKGVNINPISPQKKPDINWLFETPLEILYKEHLNDKIKGNIFKIIGELPQKGAVFQIGIMLARHSKKLRICTSMPIIEYNQYLEKIDWNGEIKHLSYLLNTLGKYLDAVFVDLDIGEEISPAIGLECCYRKGNNGASRLEKFLKYLIERKLCLKEQAEFILKWIGDAYYPGKIPVAKVIKKTLSHIKILVNPDTTLKAKAYLSVSF